MDYVPGKTTNVAPCLVLGGGKQMGSLSSVRQDMTSRAAYECNRHSTSSSHLSMSWLVPDNPNSMLEPSPRPALNRGYLAQKSSGPGRALVGVTMINRVRH